VEHPKEVGEKSALAIMVALQMRGYTVLIPLGENTRYDLVIDDGQALARVQCKTGRLRQGAVVFATTSSYNHHKNARTARRGYAGEADFFGVFCPETNGVYLVPVGEVPTRSSASLRVQPTRNAQTRGIREAVRYEIGQVAVT
jgi:hypothetical protein